VSDGQGSPDAVPPLRSKPNASSARVTTMPEGPQLRDIERVVVPDLVLEETWQALRSFGKRGREGLVLWAGELAEKRAIVRMAVTPAQNAIESEDGIGYFLTAETLFEVNLGLAKRKLRLLAQVHSHPGEAYHSSTDDRYAIVTTEGGFSLVVPRFAAGPAAVGICAIYRLHGSEWRELNHDQVARTFQPGEE
jgi:Prokaryotic homologs of the JAB domain